MIRLKDFDFDTKCFPNHPFNDQKSYELDEAFFKLFDQKNTLKGKLYGCVKVRAEETFVEVSFKVDGEVWLICDLTLKPFNFFIQLAEKLIFNYQFERDILLEERLGYELSNKDYKFNIAQVLYDSIMLELPIQKIDPNARNNSSEGITLTVE